MLTKKKQKGIKGGFSMENLEKIEKEFKKILESKDNQENKNINLSRLMTQLERGYNIPLLKRNTTKETLESKEFKLYLEIAKARKN